MSSIELQEVHFTKGKCERVDSKRVRSKSENKSKRKRR